MSKFLKHVLFLVILLGLISNTYAFVKVKVKGEVETKKKNPGVQLVNQAFINGQEQALRKWSAGLDSQRLKIINELWDEIVNDLSTYIFEVTQLSDGQWANGKWGVNLEVTINDAQINQLINQRFQSSGQSHKDSYLSFVYVAREVGSIQISADTVHQTVSSSTSDQKTFDQKNETYVTTDFEGNLDVSAKESASSKSKTSMDHSADANVSVEDSKVMHGSSSIHRYNDDNNGVRKTSRDHESSKSAHLSSSGQFDSRERHDNSSTFDIAFDESSSSSFSSSENLSQVSNKNREQLSKYQSSGYVVKNSEGISYRVFNPQEIDAKVTEVFNKSGFDLVPSYEIDITPELLAYDFATLNDISSSTLKEATDAARDAGIDFLAIGMLDIGREEIDPVTGQYKVYAKVNGFIMDLRKKFAIKICSVGPVQYGGWGQNPTVAKTNALIEASEKASNDLVDQLRVKLNM